MTRPHRTPAPRQPCCENCPRVASLPSVARDRGYSSDPQLRLLLLDALPLTDEVGSQHTLLGSELQRHLLAAFVCDDDACCAQSLRHTRALITLARDLGYIDAAVSSYVCRSIDRLLAQHPPVA